MKRYLRENLQAFFIFFACVIVFLSVFYLYHLPLAAVIYPVLICIFILSFYFFKGYINFSKKHKTLKMISEIDTNISENLSVYNDIIDEDYRSIIENLERNIAKLKSEDEKKIIDMMDYYTRWVHQIKTPISSISLILQNNESEISSEIAAELFSIENYVNMALCYARLDAETNDFVFEKTELDSIIKESVRKYSKIFIKKKIALDFNETKAEITTDKKWLMFVIEQIISNALKYTKSGKISIEYKDGRLFIKDTGIGIMQDDISRIFEKGYTGFNGRMEKRSSGIGLYLCKKICDRMGYEISVSSKLGEGTTVIIDLKKKESIFE